MIYIMHKVLVLTKNHINYLKYNIFKFFLKSKIDFYFFLKNNFFHNYIMMKNPRFEEEKIIKDIRNLFRLKKAR